MGFGMSATSISSGRRPADVERRERILEGAERAFVRHGFHATTMQHVADELGMSAGNLYRYFPSKDAIVEGLCAVDQEGRAKRLRRADGRQPQYHGGDQRGLRSHVFAHPPEKARLIGRDLGRGWPKSPRGRDDARQIDADVLAGLEKLMDAAKAGGAASPRLDSRFGARFFLTFVAGLFKRMAIEPDFDAEAEAGDGDRRPPGFVRRRAFA